MSPRLFDAVTALSPIIAVAAGLTSYHRLTGELRLLLLYCVVSFFVGAVSLFVFALRGINNHLLTHVFTTVQFSILFFLLTRWQSQSASKKFFYGALVVVLIAWVFGFVWVEDLRGFGTVMWPIASLLLVLAASITLVQTTRTPTVSPSRNPILWVSSGVLVYFAAMSMHVSLGNMLLEISGEELFEIWMPLQAMLSVTLNSFFAVGFLCLRPK